MLTIRDMTGNQGAPPEHPQEHPETIRVISAMVDVEIIRMAGKA
jgi:hypothetical protein